MPELPLSDDVEERARGQQWSAWQRALPGDEGAGGLGWLSGRLCQLVVDPRSGLAVAAARPSWPWFSRRADAKRLRPPAKIRIPESAPALHPTSSLAAAA